MDISARRSWDVPWDQRAREEAANLNPAFCGELLSRSVGEYRRVREHPMPFPLAFLILPIALHPKTRSLLPGNSSASFVTWIAERRAFLTDVPERVVRLIPITREAILFSIQHSLIAFDEGSLTPGKKRLNARTRPALSTDDSDDIRRTSALLGRWFASQGAASSILYGFGVTP
jgi:hypothetical protein